MALLQHRDDTVGTHKCECVLQIPALLMLFVCYSHRDCNVNKMAKGQSQVVQWMYMEMVFGDPLLKSESGSKYVDLGLLVETLFRYRGAC